MNELEIHIKLTPAERAKLATGDLIFKDGGGLRILIVMDNEGHSKMEDAINEYRWKHPHKEAQDV